MENQQQQPQSSQQTLSQQNSTISGLVKSCCEDQTQYQELSLQIVQFAKANRQNKDAARPIIDTIKLIIKDKKLDSPSKVLALKLLNRCVSDEGALFGEEFMIYLEKKILSRLNILARHKKESSDIEKGAQIFGKSANQRASADFLKLLLLFIQQWASRFPVYSTGKQTELAKIYQSLVKDRIHIPSESSVLQSLSENYTIDPQNPTMSAPQNQGVRGVHLNTTNVRKDLNQSQLSSSTSSRRNTTNVALDQSERKSLNQSALNMSVVQPGNDSSHTSQQLQEFAIKIKGDYKKLNEYQGTAKLVQEVVQGNKIDDELLVAFRQQLMDGKTFAEGFLTTIIETPFQIKDRDSKIDKILSIIGEIETQLNRILALKPLTKEEMKPLASQQSNSKTPSEPQRKKSNPNLNQTEVKGILKPAKFQTATKPQEPANSDFNFDQSSFKTHFAINPNQSVIMNNNDNNFWNAPQTEQQQVQPPVSFMDFSAFNHQQKSVPKPEAFDFGAGFVNSQPQPVLKGVEEFKWGAEPEQSRNRSNLNDRNERPSFVEERKSIPEKRSFVVLSQPKVQADQSKPQSKVADGVPSRKSSNVSMKSFKSVGADEKFAVMKNITSQQPQISSRSHDSQPNSEENGDVSSSEEKVSFNIPSTFQENQFKLGGNTGKATGTDFEFSWGEPFPSFSRDVSRLSLGAGAADNSSHAQRQSSEKNRATNNFEKFDFSEVQHSQHSSRKSSHQQRKVDELQTQIESLEQQVTTLKQQLITSQNSELALQSQLKQLQSTVDTLNQDIKRATHFEFLYEEEKLTSSQLEAQIRSLNTKSEDFKKQSDRTESKLSKSLKQIDSLNEQILNLQHQVEHLQKEVDIVRESESVAKKQIQQELIESRRREEDLRAQMQIESQESKKRETVIKESWLKDLQEKEANMEEWDQKLTDMESKIRGKDEEINELKRKINELETQAAQKIVIKTHQIKFNKELQSSSSKANTPKPNGESNKKEPLYDMSFPDEATHNIAQYNNQSPTESHSLFQSVIKPQADTEFKATEAFKNFDEAADITLRNKQQEIVPEHHHHEVEVVQEQIIRSDTNSSEEEEKENEFFSLEDQPDVLIPTELDKKQLNHNKIEEVKQSDFSFPETKVDNEVEEADPFSFPVTAIEQKSDPFNFGLQSPVKEIEQMKLNQQQEEIHNKIDDLPIPKQEEVSHPDPSTLTTELNQISPSKKEKPPKGDFDFSVFDQADDPQPILEANPLTLLDKTHVQDYTVGLHHQEQQESEQVHIQLETVQQEDLYNEPQIKQIPERKQSDPFDIFNKMIEPSKMIQITKEEEKVNQIPEVPQQINNEPQKSSQIESRFNIDDLLSGIESQEQQNIERNNSDPFSHLEQKNQIDSPFKTANHVQVANQEMIHKPNVDQEIDKSRFSTINTEVYQKEQQREQVALQQANPQIMMQVMLAQFFRKSLQSNKAVVYEDPNIQIGMVADYQPNLVRMRLFFGNKNLPGVYQIGFHQVMKPFGYQVQQSKESIPELLQGQQDPIDINLNIESYQLSIPVYNLTYRLAGTPLGQPSASLPVRLPLMLLKLCQGLPAQLETSNAYLHYWSTLQSSESRIQFNIDFNQCRSLTQLRELLKLGRNAMSFVEGVEQQKNIVCGGTLFPCPSRLGKPLIALIKVKLTVDGINCEITGRSNDLEEEIHGKFSKYIIGNILELIAMPNKPVVKQQV